MDGTEAYPEHERPVDAWCDPDMLYVRLADHRKIGVPIWWHPFLLKATRRERATVELSASGVWWSDLDEGVSVKSMIIGWKSPTATKPESELSYVG